MARRDLGYEKTEWYVPHITRHTACTRMLQKGVPLPVVSAWLGVKSSRADAKAPRSNENS